MNSRRCVEKKNCRTEMSASSKNKSEKNANKDELMPHKDDMLLKKASDRNELEA